MTKTAERSYWLILLILIVGCNNVDYRSSKVASDAEWKPPNILWIVAEDLSPIIPSFGDSTAKTPNLDRLAKMGVRFPNTFSVSGVCAPSRAAIATGMYPTSIGAHNMRVQWNEENMTQNGLILYEVVPPAGVKMMSTILRENGYYTTNNDKTDYQFKPTIVAWDELGDKAHYRHRPDPEQPFFSIFNLDITHESQVWMTGKKNLRFKEGLEDPESPSFVWNDVLAPEDRPPLTVGEDVPIPPYLVDAERTRQDIRRVYSNIEIMDQQVGFLLGQLEEDELLDNTIIFWYTDHGGPLPRQKRLVYDSGLRVPMIVAFPDGQGAGTIDSNLVSFVDLAPTVFSLAGIQPPEYIQGQAFLGPYAAPPRRFIHAAADRFDAIYDHMRATRDHRWKYIHHPKPDMPYYIPVAYRENMGAMQDLLDGYRAGTLNPEQALWFRQNRPEEELFDTWNDPHELNNLAGQMQYAGKLAELRGATKIWQRTYGDLGELPEKEVLTMMWGDDWKQPKANAPYSGRTEDGKFTLQSNTKGAVVGYRIMPQDRGTNRWRIYTEPLERVPGDTIHARADRIGYLPSELSVGF